MHAGGMLHAHYVSMHACMQLCSCAGPHVQAYTPARSDRCLHELIELLWRQWLARAAAGCVGRFHHWCCAMLLLLLLVGSIRIMRCIDSLLLLLLLAAKQAPKEARLCL